MHLSIAAPTLCMAKSKLVIIRISCRVSHSSIFYLRLKSMRETPEDRDKTSGQRPAYAPAFPANKTLFAQLSQRKAGVLRGASKNSRTSF